MRVFQILIIGTALTSVGVGIVACGDGATDPTEPSRPTTVTIAVTTVRLASADATVQLEALVHDQYGQVMTDARVAWSSDAALVASVDAEGLVTAVGQGTAEIVAAAGLASGTSTVTVAQAGNSDRAALVALYEATDGPNWVNNENWLTDAPLGEWFGVETDSLGRVVRLEMTYYDWDRREWVANNLSGTLPAELGDLAKLERMYLRSNTLTGPIPAELGNLSNLERLDLRYNSLTGPIPAELGGLVNLTRMLLGGNELSGSIPPELGGLGHLTVLNLGTNRLTGSVPPEFGDLADLEQLYLDDNGLTGSIPSELGNLSNLENLYLNSNDLTGPIPSELAALANLERLYLGSNGLAGPIPSEIGGLTNLKRLYLDNNSLTGPIPSELGNLANLERLYLYSNGLEGPIPSELGGLANLERLYLDNNDLTGPVPSSFLQLDRLGRFHIAENESLCLPGIRAFAAWIAGIEDRDTAPISCNAEDVFELTLLFELVGGSDWTRSDGWLGDFVVEEWHGVTADSLGRVLGLDLSDNGLSGWLPSTLGTLSQMTALRIDGNSGLLGRLPDSLTDLPLRTLHYRGTKLCTPAHGDFRAWLIGIPSHEGTGVECPPMPDHESVEAVYEAAKRCMLKRSS